MNNVHCPHCHKAVVWSEAFPYRPFCSKRCRLIDLGAWADGSYSIPAASPPTAANASEEVEDEDTHTNNSSNNDGGEDEDGEDNKS
jgi:endogenous inhibitor of DNA gyrase (YacG/DUF329 family)